MAQPAQADEIVLRLSGDGVEASTFPPTDALTVALRFFELVKGASKGVGLRGIMVRDGCVEFAVRASHEAGALAAVRAVDVAVRSGSKRAKTLSKALKMLPSHVNVEAVSSTETVVLHGHPSGGVATYMTLERAFVEGAKLPMGTESGVVFLALLSGERVTLRASEVLAKHAHAMPIHQEVDADVDLLVDEHQHIRGGVLKALHACQPTSMDALQAWGRDAFAHWGAVEDVEAALNGERDDDE